MKKTSNPSYPDFRYPYFLQVVVLLSNHYYSCYGSFVTYTDRDEWILAVGGEGSYNEETFNSFTTDVSFNNGASVTLDDFVLKGYGDAVSNVPSTGTRWNMIDAASPSWLWSGRPSVDGTTQLAVRVCESISLDCEEGFNIAYFEPMVAWGSYFGQTGTSFYVNADGEFVDNAVNDGFFGFVSTDNSFSTIQITTCERCNGAVTNMDNFVYVPSSSNDVVPSADTSPSPPPVISMSPVMMPTRFPTLPEITDPPTKSPVTFGSSSHPTTTGTSTPTTMTPSSRPKTFAPIQPPSPAPTATTFPPSNVPSSRPKTFAPIQPPSPAPTATIIPPSNVPVDIESPMPTLTSTSMVPSFTTDFTTATPSSLQRSVNPTSSEMPSFLESSMPSDAPSLVPSGVPSTTNNTVVGSLPPNSAEDDPNNTLEVDVVDSSEAPSSDNEPTSNNALASGSLSSFPGMYYTLATLVFSAMLQVM